MRTVLQIDGIKLTPLTIEEVLSDIFLLLAKREKSCQITYLNAYVYCLAKRNSELKSIIADSEIVLSDGVSLIGATFFVKRLLIPRSVMTRVFDAFIISSKVPASKCILIGATDPEVTIAMENINKLSPNIKVINAYSGYHNEDYYSVIFQEYRNIDLILIGCSTPKSEYLCKIARSYCKNSIVWHIGGGTIKCYANTKNRAPEWISKLGIEWCHRFIYEKHTRKRYLIYNFVFIYLIIIAFFKSLKPGISHI